MNTSTPFDPTSYFTGFFGILVALLAIFIAITAIFLPLFVMGIYNTLRRIENLHRAVAVDIVTELRAQRQPRQP